MLPGGSSGHQLLMTLFNSPWAWDCVIVGFIAGATVIGALWSMFALGSRRGGARRRMQVSQERGAGLQPGKHACPSPEVHHSEQFQAARGDAP